MRQPAIFLVSVVLLSGLAACGGATQTSSPSLAHVTINSAPLTSYAPIFIAEENGYFDEEGIDLEFVPFARSIEALPVFVSGDIDIYASSMTAGLLNVISQEDIRVVADRGHIDAADTCANGGILIQKDLYDSGTIKGPEDMKGLKFGLQSAGVAAYTTSQYLASAGLTLDDIEMINVSGANLSDAFANGGIDVAPHVEPILTKVISDGHAVLGPQTQEVVGNLQTSVLLFGNRLLEEDRELGVRFLKAYLRGVQAYNEGKTESNVAILAEYTGESEELLRKSCWVSIDPNGWIDFDASVAGFQQWSFDQGQLDSLLTESNFWDPSLLQEALDQLGD